MGVTPQQILQAREYRAGLQQEFIHTYGLPLVCFTMNIAGPKKDSPWSAAPFTLAVKRFWLLSMSTMSRSQASKHV